MQIAEPGRVIEHFYTQRETPNGHYEKPARIWLIDGRFTNYKLKDNGSVLKHINNSMVLVHARG